MERQERERSPHKHTHTDTHTQSPSVSLCCRTTQVAAAVAQAIQADQIFDFRSRPSPLTNGPAGNQEGNPTLLILDRRDDPVTPL